MSLRMASQFVTPACIHRMIFSLRATQIDKWDALLFHIRAVAPPPAEGVMQGDPDTVRLVQCYSTKNANESLQW